LYIGLLRECFCVCGGLNPLSWENTQVVYRGAQFSLDIVADYARRPDELIRWEGFTSSSPDPSVALGFPGNVLFEISLHTPVASLGDVSAFTSEREVVLSPYQRFSLNGVRWEESYGRWILSVGEETGVAAAESWFLNPGASSGS
jgi:hypothetical protein